MVEGLVFDHPIGRVESARRAAFCRLMEWLGYRQFVMRVQGVPLLVGTVDEIDKNLARKGIWDASQLEEMARFCRTHAVDCFLDIGANAGVYSVLLLHKGLVPRAIAFEPDPGNYAHLLANILVSGIGDKVQPVPLALGDVAGEVTLSEAGPWNRGESWIMHADKPPEEATTVATHRVQQVRFDDAFAFSGKMLLVKIDVEGSEFHTLAGMARTLRENRCVLQVELYSDRLDDLKRVFAEAGYRFFKTDYIDHYFTNIDDVT